MKISSIHVKNYRSIVDTGEIRMNHLQTFVGENNSGKSNILKSIDIFLSPGVGGVQESDFFDKTLPIIIKAKFSSLSPEEAKALRIYMIGDELILEKKIFFQPETDNTKSKLVSEYRGYQAKPKDWWLTIGGVEAHEGTNRPDWKKVAAENGVGKYVENFETLKNITKPVYEKAIGDFLKNEEGIQYDTPTLGDTQALGIQPNLLRFLPRFYMLTAVTDYSSEIDKRSSNTIFRRLMADLANRILITDERYSEVEDALNKLNNLLNNRKSDSEISGTRLKTLDAIEENLTGNIRQLMPSVMGVSLSVELETTREYFSRGVSLRVDDGVLTDVLQKGHGLQRSVVFGLLRMLIDNQRATDTSILLAIEEPELYIHPQMQRLIYGVLREFSKTDQVVYTTHSPSFVDIAEYNSIALVRKVGTADGTKIHQCVIDVFGDIEERKVFKLLNSFGLAQNQVFFSRRTILVEGEQDMIAIVSTARKLGIFIEYPEEIGFTIVLAGAKGEMPKFQKVLNAFGIPCIVIHEMDGKDENHSENKAIIENLGSNQRVIIPKKLENSLGLSKHFDDTFQTKKFFSDPSRITPQFEEIVREIFRI